MQNGYDNNLSLRLYDYLCKKIGTEEQVRVRRLYYSAGDMLSETDGVAFITSGSRGEGLDMKGSDKDIMYLNKDIHVVEDVPTRREQLSHTYLIDSNNTKQGFARLLLCSRGICCHDSELCTEYNQNYFLSSEKVKYVLKSHTDFIDRNICKIHGPCITDEDEELDFAFCVRCPTWIRQAEKWPTRSRVWPSSDLILKIVRYGVLFVPIGCKDSPFEDIEWRMSFSVAEKLLVYSFNHTQLLCYALLKILLKEVIKSNLLCSYFLKTIVFWVSEENAIEWKPSNMVNCFQQCFKRLSYCVQYSVLPHYFIIDSNLFEDRFNSRDGMDLNVNISELFQTGIYCLTFSDFFSDLFRNYRSMTKRQEHLYNRFHAVYLEVQKLDIIFGVSSDNTLTLVQNMILINRYYTCRKRCIERFLLKTVFFLLCWKETCDIITINTEDKNLLSWKKTRDIITINTEEKNKDSYHIHKRTLVYSLLGVKIDATNGWLKLALKYYRLGKIDASLRMIDNALHVDRSSLSINNSTLNYFNKSLESYSDDDLCLAHKIFGAYCFEEFFLPGNAMTSRSAAIGRFFTVPPIVFAHYLNFLCYFHVRNYRKCQDSLQSLESSLKYVKMKNDDMKIESCQLFSLASDMYDHVKDFGR